MKVIKEEHGFPIKMWTDGVPVEQGAIEQLSKLARMPFIHNHVAVMPDCHQGIGATVGSVIATKGAVIPAAVGVDLGCGMVAVKTNLVASDLPDSLSEMRSAIEAAVPHGRTNNGGAGDQGAWSETEPPMAVVDAWAKPDFRDTRIDHSLGARFQQLCRKHHHLEKSNNLSHLGTLGGGNHFIEICLDTEQNVWVMLHSGSRGVGGRIGQYFINLAKEDMRKWFINLPDTDLAYFPEETDHFHDYVEAVEWAQDFARVSRQIMMNATLGSMEKVLGRMVQGKEAAVNCHHNYISRERHFGENVIVTRKGAVSAAEGELGIIPGSMGAKSFIVRGKGNRDSFHSCSHGAGRIMSRTEAKKRFTLGDHILATQGVNCRKDFDVIDETPGAYKDIDKVMAAQTDLVDIVATLKQVLCVKG
jgi:tRNA-splicing ligase RtcB (3'-phosphate/5'-hydroxy nucleic acid ligase)